MIVIAENKLYNAGHTRFTLVETRQDSFIHGDPQIITYTLYNNSCPLWDGVSKEDGLREFDKVTKAAW